MVDNISIAFLPIDGKERKEIGRCDACTGWEAKARVEGVIFNNFNEPERRLTKPAITIKHKRDKLGTKVSSIGEVFAIL